MTEPITPPLPWRKISHYNIGGLRNVGYATGTDLLLVVSNDGVGLFNCQTGEKIGRDRDHRITYQEEVQLTAIGIGAIQGQIVRMAGLHGGGLRHSTEDGWHLEVEAPRWPHQDIYLIEPFEPGNLQKRFYVANDEPCELRTFGFSETGKTFIVASSCELVIFSQE